MYKGINRAYNESKLSKEAWKIKYRGGDYNIIK